MYLTLIIFISVLLAAALPVLPAQATPVKISLPQLRQKLESIGAELEQLADYNLRSGSGSVGYASKAHKNPDNKEWVRIELGTPSLIDQIVLVPSIWRDPKYGLQSEGFPIAFQILIGTANSTNIVASFTAKDALLPRIAPLVVSCPPTSASWVAVEATTLSPRGWDQQHALHLSEILVFSNLENVAINKPVSASSSRRIHGREKQFLVDGFVPYLMDSAQGEKSHPVNFQTDDESEQPALTIDLGKSYPINQINLHLTNLGCTVPDATPSDYAIPPHLLVTGANRPDFADQTSLFEFRKDSIYNIGPILIQRFPEKSCRYVKVDILELHHNLTSFGKKFSARFSEIEILSNGKNIALGKSIRCSQPIPPRRVLARLTDGNNFFGQILPMRDWMSQLARRHNLETERPLIETELNQRYELQKNNLNRMCGLSILLACGIIITILIDRMLRMKHVAKIKSRFAADLHDELGADLHTIGLLSDLASEARNNPRKLNNLLLQIRTTIEETGPIVHNLTNLQEANVLGPELSAELQRTAERILPHLTHVITLEGETFLNQLQPRSQIDLFLFYKECLINICRHADASRLETCLTASKHGVLLTITDNGTGVKQVPSSLKRRARLMRAHLSVESPESGGTFITLRLRRRLISKPKIPNTEHDTK
jgi:signal transduction histidine kinase